MFGFLLMTILKAAVWARRFEKAATYMAEQFHAAGLEPAGVNGYRQPIDFQVVQIDETRCSLTCFVAAKCNPLNSATRPSSA